MTHPVQLLDGSNVTFLVGALALPTRPTATLSGGLLTFTNEPTQMLLVPGSTTSTLTVNKNNQEFRLFNDDGWKQSKITARSFQITLSSYFVKNTSATDPDLDAAFAILQTAALSDELEIYIKFRKFLAQYTTTGGSPATYNRYATRAGTVKVTEFSEQMPADGLTELNLTLMGEGQLYVGNEDVVAP